MKKGSLTSGLGYWTNTLESRYDGGYTKWIGKVKHENYAYKLLLWGFFFGARENIWTLGLYIVMVPMDNRHEYNNPLWILL